MEQSAKARYESLVSERQPYLNRAYDCAELTIPSLLPRLGHSSSQELPTPWQDLGARGVRNLTAKLLLVMFPPNAPFFRWRLDDIELKKAEAKIGEEELDKLRTEIEKGLSAMERAVQAEIEISADRIANEEVLKHLLVTGNAVVHYDDKSDAKVYHLSNFVVHRDPRGAVLELITKECVSPLTLDEPLRKRLLSHERGEGEEGYNREENVELYTRVVRTEKNWEVYQEICGEEIPGTHGTYPLDRCPWIALRLIKIDGENYGRGYVEEFLGSLRSLDALARAIVEGSAAASKVLFLVNPNGTTRAKDIAEAPNGAIRSGNHEDVSVVHVEKFNDFRVAKDMAVEISQSLQFSFLMNSSVQRNAERVTAEEIRYMAQELEVALGGVYTILAREWQYPYIKIKTAQLEKRGRLPKLPSNTVKPVVVTGLEALGRGNDRAKLTTFLQTLAGTMGPQAISQYINVGEVIQRLAMSDGIETHGLVRTDEELAASAQQQYQQQLAMQVAPKAAGPIGNMMMEGMKPNGEQPES